MRSSSINRDTLETKIKLKLNIDGSGEGSVKTGIGFFDDWVCKVKCGLIIPTTGFAHSMTSCALEYKKAGLITGVGANFFKLAGSVLLYGIISSFFLCLIKVVFYG